MKKFLLFAALAAVAASADATVYIVGQDQGWDIANPIAIEAANGVYTYTTAADFKVSSVQGGGVWDTFNAGCVCVEGGNWNKDTQAKTATGKLVKANANISTPFTGAETTFTINEALTDISCSAPDWNPDAATPLYIRGTINDWGASADWELKSTDGKIYTINNVTIAAGEKFKIADANWSQTYNWGSDGTISQIEAGKSYTLVAGSNSTDLTSAGLDNVTMTFNTTDNTLTVSGGGQVTVTTPDHLYLIGAYNDMNWDPANSLELTKDGTTFSISDITITGSANFSFATVQGTWDDVNAAVRYGAGLEKDVKIELVDKVGTAPVFGEINSNMKAFELAKGTYNMSVAFATDGITLTVTQTAEAPVVEDLVLTGSFNSWAANDPAYKFTKDGDTYTLSVAQLEAEAELKVKTADEAWATTWGAGEEASVVNNTAMEAWLGSQTNFVVPETLTDVTITFVRSDSPSVAATLTISGTAGVESVEAAQTEAPAEYFNLQGIRVANPEAGQLYILRQGNNVSKVIR